MNRYIVTYDICDERRLRQVYKAMRGWGDHIQYSVFRCDLTPKARMMMVADLDKLLHHDEDQILIIDVGPVGGRSEGCIEALGRAYIAPERHARVF